MVIRTVKVFLRAAITLACGGFVICVPGVQGAANFINFETAPVHPVALSPDGRTLAICNLPDGRVELFDVANGIPVAGGSVLVGIDPVSLRFHGTNELWVANFISSSVNIIDVFQRRVVAVLPTLAGPADVAFAGAPERAFVSCARSNAVMVFDPQARTWLANIAIDGDRPTAMAVNPDRTRVFVAIFESGNASTILGSALTPLDVPPAPGVVDNTNGPYGGQNPPPNSGRNFNPPINPDLPSNQPPPRVSHIVKKDSAGRWMDDNGGDWTEFVSGTNAALSGRVRGWNMPDHDVAVIDASAFNVSYLSGLMNLCMDVAVNPGSGRVAVIGTEATNERRFEPMLKSTFLRVEIALANLVAHTNIIKDLNPHLDYAVRSIPQSERDKSLGDPRGIVWSSDGTRGYVTGMGSRNLVVIDGNGERVQAQPVELPDGPTGLALDEPRGRLYVFNRFASSIAVVDTASLTVLTNVPVFDPTPSEITHGRKHLYDTRKTSGLGQVSCASCHPDGRMDRLAWDLGNPAGSLITNGAVFHPMKGPMVTQTLQDILLFADGEAPPGGLHTPLHWRGDRNGIEDFNQTFTNLLGSDVALTPTEMRDFKALMTNIYFPPNPLRTFENRLSTNVPLPGLYGVDADRESPGSPLPPGDAARGFLRTDCRFCHGLGRGGFLALTARPRSNGTTFRNAQLRNLADKLGMDLTQTNSRAGFGFMHDGRVDTLSRFLIDGFSFTDNQQLADTIAFLLSIPGSDLDFFHEDEPSRDVPAATGKQLIMTSSETNELLDAMLALARDMDPETTKPKSRVQLMARGVKEQLARSWLYDAEADWFQSDRNLEHHTLTDLLALASPATPVLFMLVPFPSGQRIALDHDDDGYFDRTEIEYGTDPDSRLSSPLRLIDLARTNGVATIRWQGVIGEVYNVWSTTNLSNAFSLWEVAAWGVEATSRVSTIKETNLGAAPQRFYRVFKSP